VLSIYCSFGIWLVGYCLFMFDLVVYCFVLRFVAWELCCLHGSLVFVVCYWVCV